MQDQFNTQNAALSETSPYGEVWEEYDPRFIREPAAEIGTAADRTRLRAQRQRRQDAREARSTQVSAALAVLSDHGVKSSAVLTRKELGQLFGLFGRGAISNIVARNGDELEQHGSDGSTFPASAVALVGLLLRPTSSALAAEIQSEAAGWRPLIKFGGGEDHRDYCAGIFADAAGIACDLRDEAPEVVWVQLREMDKHRLMATAVALASLVYTDRPGLGEWLQSLDPDADGEGEASIIGGLRQLVATRATGHGSAPSAHLTPDEVGL